MIKKIILLDKSLGYKWQQSELVSGTCFRMLGSLLYIYEHILISYEYLVKS